MIVSPTTTSLNNKLRMKNLLFILLEVSIIAISIGCTNQNMAGIIKNTQLKAQKEFIIQLKTDIERYNLAKKDGIIEKAIDSIVSTMALRETDTLFLIENSNPPMFEYQYYVILLSNDNGWIVYRDGIVYDNYKPRNESEKKLTDLVREFDYKKIRRYEHEKPLAYYGSDARNRIITRIIVKNKKIVDVKSYIIMNDINFFEETGPIIFD